MLDSSLLSALDLVHYSETISSNKLSIIMDFFNLKCCIKGLILINPLRYSKKRPLRWVKYTYSNSWTNNESRGSKDLINLLMKCIMHYFRKLIVSTIREYLKKDQHYKA